MAEPEWYVLIHQLPPRPLYLRARIRQRLERVGAIALKNSVYVVPHTPACAEDLQWIAQEAVAGGGAAFVCEAAFLVGPVDLPQRFRRARAADYAELIAEARTALSALRRRPRADREDDLGARLRRLKRRLQEIVAIDFFGAEERTHAEAALRALESRLHPAPAGRASHSQKHADLVGKLWVTRRGVHVDRIASAWLVRRFVDPAARFRFVEAHQAPPRPEEVRFDMVDGDFTHRGDRCTFEDLVAHLGLADAAIASIAEIVHDIDLKDAKFARPEAAGVEQMVTGLCRAHADDDERLERGVQLFDDLYLAYSKPTNLVQPKPKPPGPRPKTRKGGKP